MALALDTSFPPQAPNDALLGVEIGGTNIRTGVVLANLECASDCSKAEVWRVIAHFSHRAIGSFNVLQFV